MTDLGCNGMNNRDTFFTINVVVTYLFFLTDKQNILDQDFS